MSGDEWSEAGSFKIISLVQLSQGAPEWPDNMKPPRSRENISCRIIDLVEEGHEGFVLISK